jgi:hypothetical protein
MDFKFEFIGIHVRYEFLKYEYLDLDKPKNINPTLYYTKKKASD